MENYLMSCLKFSAHLDLFFVDKPPIERIRLFHELGYHAFELWCWWDYNLEELWTAAQKYNMSIAALCTRFVSLVDRQYHEEYLKGLEETITVCRKLDCRIIISQVGRELDNCSRDIQQSNLISGLKKASTVLKGTNCVLAVEPLNVLVDHKGYYLSSSPQAETILKAVNSPNIQMLFDIYHQQISEGNLSGNIQKLAPLISHYHIADHPGRHEPGSGEINYSFVLNQIQKTGYSGYIGLEWIPVGDNLKSLQEFLLKYSI
jgi:hydroxypyruvate isomerase